MEPLKIEGKLVDLTNGSVIAATLTVVHGIIQKITKQQHNSGPYIIPGFIDSHVHIESSMLVPSEFARLAVCHGTVATVSDPHEIGNVLGVEGIEFMIKNSREVNFKCFFGAPSCVPATTFETSGAVITSDDVDYLLSKPEVHYLAEMMNWPGVLNGNPEVLKKIQLSPDRLVVQER
jgi:adenine deaminase